MKQNATNTNGQRSSPMELRDDGLEGDEVLEPYQPPRMLTRQAKIDRDTMQPSERAPAGSRNQQGGNGEISNTAGSRRRTWLSRLSSGSRGQQDFRSKLSKRMARLSSLESTRSFSSADESTAAAHHQRLQLHPQTTTMPLISITNNDNPAGEQSAPESISAAAAAAPLPVQMLPPFAFPSRIVSRTPPQKPARQISSAAQRRADYYGRSSYNKSRKQANQTAGGHERTGRNNNNNNSNNNYNNGDDYDDEDDDDEDAFEDAPLPVPYSSSSMARTVVVRQQTDRGISYPSGRLEELLDDRQGMNSGEQQFTKAEKQANRPSLDGSIISGSDYRLANSKGLPAGGGSGGGGGKIAGAPASKSRDKRRSKSPSSMYRSRRQSRRGLLGLASRLKLTKKHESIAKLQLSILNSGFVSLKTLDRDLQSFLPRERSNVRDFQERVKLMRQFEVLSTIEYRFASKYETYVCKHAQTEINQPKNNYKKCIPYDYNRIVLKTLPNVPDSDYINASHVDSCLKPNAYIAAQGPNEFTIEDFWRMIWEQKTFVIVMLTKVFDFIRVMCNQYWPVELNKPERYGNIEVTLLYEEPLADFVIRTIKIAKLRAGTTASAGAAQSADGKVPSNGSPPSVGQNHREPRAFDRRDAAIALDGTRETSNRRASVSDDELLENYNSDDTSASGALEDEDPEVVELRPERGTPLSGQSLGVRAPRFVATGGRGSGKRRSTSRGRSLPPEGLRVQRAGRANSQDDLNGGGQPEQTGTPATSGAQRADSALSANSNDATSGLQQASNLVRAKAAARPPNEFLHPLFNGHQLGASSNSLNSEPPGTPRTPSSAGLDRSSATRRAVKKKRRERVKNQRPKRTQFMVPTESQLEDDDEDEGGDYENGNNHEDDDDKDKDKDEDDDDDEDSLAGNLGGLELHANKLKDDDHKRRPKTKPNGRPTKSNERIIYQFHYNSWASHTCPFISSLLHFRRRVRICMDEMSKSGRTGPTVVHCNDGCGRTGAYLSIDANLELAEEDNVLDIYNYARKMRQSRKYLIENLEQYKFVYDTIEEAIYCGKTWFPVSELHKRLKHKSQRNPITRKNEYLLEYEKICRMTSKFSIGDCAGGHRVENREKNRDVSTVPPDNFRPYLTSFQTNDSTDYINAVFVDGYTRSKEYIVTEWPLHKTISDFWSLIYDHDCNSVILLANPSESSTYPSFLPSEKELRRKFGPVFSAEMVSYTHYQNIKSWIYTISKKIVSLTEVIAGVKSEAKTTQVFQITCWPQGHRVPTSTNALVELMNMVERWRQRTTYGPVCVVSLNGKSRAGVYCAANVAIEQVIQHSEVDVFNAVKTVRRHRPQLIENMTEYKYCYDLILHYVLHYVNNQSTSGNN